MPLIRESSRSRTPGFHCIAVSCAAHLYTAYSLPLLTENGVSTVPSFVWPRMPWPWRPHILRLLRSALVHGACISGGTREQACVPLSHTINPLCVFLQRAIVSRRLFTGAFARSLHHIVSCNGPSCKILTCLRLVFLFQPLSFNYCHARTLLPAV